MIKPQTLLDFCFCLILLFEAPPLLEMGSPLICQKKSVVWTSTEIRELHTIQTL